MHQIISKSVHVVDKHQRKFFINDNDAFCAYFTDDNKHRNDCGFSFKLNRDDVNRHKTGIFDAMMSLMDLNMVHFADRVCYSFKPMHREPQISDEIHSLAGFKVSNGLYISLHKDSGEIFMFHDMYNTGLHVYISVKFTDPECMYKALKEMYQTILDWESERTCEEE